MGAVHVPPICVGPAAAPRHSIDVLDRVAGIGDYAHVLGASEPIRVFDVRFRILTLPALLAAKRATGRPKDGERIVELEALLHLRAADRKRSGVKPLAKSMR